MARKAKKLSKELGLLDVFALSTGAMISSGFFLLPGIAAAKAGPAVIAAYILSGILILPAMFAIAELSTAMPRAGGTYFFISRSLGTMFGTIDGVGEWLAMVLKCSIALVGLGAYLSAYLAVPPKAIAVCFGIAFVILNLRGAKGASSLQVGMVGLLVGIIAFFIAGNVTALRPEHFRPFAPFGVEAILPTTGFVFVSYIGLTKVASVSEEVRCPERNIPLGMLLSLGTAIAIYALGVTVVVGLLPPSELYGSLTPLADAAGVNGGRVGVFLVSLAAVLAFATTGNAGLLSASRYVLAMGRDRVVPHGFSRLSRFGTPKNALYLSGAVVLGIVLSGSPEQIAKLASTFQLLVFAFVNIAVIVMRESGIKSYDPGFRVPFYPYTPIFGVFVAVVLIPEMGILASILAAALIGLGVTWYNLYVRHRVARVGAVAKMAERVAERLLARDAHALGLDTELREILKEKGLRQGDPFAQLVEAADFIELAPGTTPEEVIRLSAQALARRSGLSPDLILDGLLERTRLGETPAEAGVALPHLLLGETDRFYMVIARSIGGIDFPLAKQVIHAVFVVLGNRKNPTQHLRFLAEIARRAEDPVFLDTWIGAPSPTAVKALLLTGSVPNAAENGTI